MIFGIKKLTGVYHDLLKVVVNIKFNELKIVFNAQKIRRKRLILNHENKTKYKDGTSYKN